MNILRSAWKQSLQSTPFVFKKINKAFGFYFLAGGMLVLCFLSLTVFSGTQGFALPWVTYAFLFFSKMFTVFMIPYYAFECSQKNVPAFWAFIKKTVWPVTIAHIKAFFIILLFLFLFIIPGLYKMIRYAFLTETVFFDGTHKEASFSALKAADHITKLYFWWITLFVTLSILTSVLFDLLVQTLVFLPPLVKACVGLVLKFYVSCFLLLYKVQLYFALKKRKDESISC